MSQNEGNDHCVEVASTRDNRPVNWTLLQLGQILAEIARSSAQPESKESYLVAEEAFSRKCAVIRTPQLEKNVDARESEPCNTSGERGVNNAD